MRRLVPDLPGRPTAEEAIRTVFFGGAILIVLGVAYAVLTASRMLVTADPFGAIFGSVVAVLLIGVGSMAGIAALAADYLHARYTVERREPVATDGGDER